MFLVRLLTRLFNKGQTMAEQQDATSSTATSLEHRREYSSKGGKEAHAQGVAHEFNSEEAREAGKLTWQKHPRTSAYMSAISKLGVQARREKAQQKRRVSHELKTD